MERLIILGCLCILIVNAQDVVNDITVEYAKVTKTSDGGGEKSIISLCNVNVPDATAENSVAVLTIQQKGENSNPDEGENINGEINGDCLEFDFSDHPQFMKVQNDIFLKVNVTTQDIEGKIKKEAIHEFKGKFTFTETNAESIEFKFYTSIKIVQFTNGIVPVFKVIQEDATTIIDQTSITCPDSSDICINPYTTAQTLAIDQLVEIYNAASDTIPISSPRTITNKDIITDCKTDVVASVVYDNDEGGQKTYEFKMVDNNGPAPCAVDVNGVKYDILTNKPQAASKFTIIYNNKCEEIETPVRDMKFLKPFDHTVEVSWDVDKEELKIKPSNEFYLEVSDNTPKKGIQNLHIDCSQDGLATCIAYVFDEAELTETKTLNYELSEFNNPGAGKSKTKETYEYVQTTPTDDEKSLKALNLNQFEINWNTNQGKLCVEDSLYKETKISQYRYELVIGFAVGKWKKHIADYIDESTICFNNFEITQLIENKLGVHFLVMKRESDTNQIVASDMITTDLIVPEISEVNDETISLEFENLNSPFLIRDEKTKNIISKNEKKIHNLAFLKSSHENKSLFNRNLVLETRKEHTQMKVHFKIPQKVNAA